MNIFVLLPILIPLLTAIGVLLARQLPRTRRDLSLGGAVVLLIAAIELLVLVWRDGVQVVQVGGWPAPFGITLVADLFSAIMVLLAALMGLGVIIYGLAGKRATKRAFWLFGLAAPAADGRERRVSHRRYVQPVCLVRAAADCLVCAAGAWAGGGTSWRARSNT